MMSLMTSGLTSDTRISVHTRDRPLRGILVVELLEQSQRRITRYSVLKYNSTKNKRAKIDKEIIKMNKTKAITLIVN